MTRPSSTDSQLGGDGKNLGDIGAKLNSICEQDSMPPSVPKKRASQEKPTPTNSEGLFQHIIEDNPFPTFFEFPPSPVRDTFVSV